MSRRGGGRSVGVLAVLARQQLPWLGDVCEKPNYIVLKRLTENTIVPSVAFHYSRLHPLWSPYKTPAHRPQKMATDSEKQEHLIDIAREVVGDQRNAELDMLFAGHSLQRKQSAHKEGSTETTETTETTKTTETTETTESWLVELLTDLDIGPIVRKRLGLAEALSLSCLCRPLCEALLTETERARNIWADAKVYAEETTGTHLRESIGYATPYACSRLAARNGYLPMLVYVYEHMIAVNCDYLKWDETTCCEAAEHGQLACLKYARENGCPWDSRTCRLAANGHLDCLQYAHEHGCPWDEQTCANAARCGSLECLQYAHENGCPWNQDACRLAAESGHLDFLHYLHENDCPWDNWTCASAARRGHLDCLRYLHEYGCPWDKWTCVDAAEEGHLDCLQYAHENGCPWDQDACRLAARRGHLDCLRYLHENGCPWDKWTWKAANRGGNEACLHYLRENNCAVV